MRRSRWLLILIAAAGTLDGAAVGDPANAGPVGIVLWFVFGIAIPALIYSWCKTDIAERNIPYPAGVPVLLVFLPAVGLPLYFFVTRSPLRAAAGLAKSIIFVAACLMLTGAGMHLHARLFS